MTWTVGPTNSLVDVAGVRVGHYTRTDDGWLTGTTVVRLPVDGAVAGVDVRGGGPGTRETDLLDPRNLVERVHAVCLSGGSAFGLAAADGVMSALLTDGVGFPMGGPGEVVPIVPGAVIFDLGRGGVFANRPDSSFGAAAYAAATDAAVAQGCVGAGRGMSAFELKGGIGTASRRAGDYTVGALVLANYGRLGTLTLAGRPLGPSLTRPAKRGDAPEKGHGSGDIALAFSTAYTLPHLPERPMPTLAMLHETRLDPLFYAAADATEQAIIHALWHAEPVRGRDGHKRRTLRELLRRLPDEDTPCAS